MIAVLDARSGRLIKQGETVSYSDGHAWRLENVKPGVVMGAAEIWQFDPGRFVTVPGPIWYFRPGLPWRVFVMPT